MFWGKERKEALHNCIFGDPNLIHPESKTLINRLYNMITLSAEVHIYWGLGHFILEPAMAESTPFELKKLRFQWIPSHRATDGVTMETLPSSLEAPLKPKYLVNVDTREAIHDGYIITLKTVDPIKAPLPSLELLNLQCHLVRVLRMAGRAGGDMLEIIESDSDISSVAASDQLERDINASSSRTAFWAGNIELDRPQLTHSPYFLNTQPLNKAPLADGSPKDVNSSSERPDEGNIAVLAAKSIELQTEPNPPSASVKSHLKKRYSLHVLVSHHSPFMISLKKRGKSIIQMISARLQKLRK